MIPQANGDRLFAVLFDKVEAYEHREQRLLTSWCEVEFDTNGMMPEGIEVALQYAQDLEGNGYQFSHVSKYEKAIEVMQQVG
jgi:hypothetical protein